MSLEMRRVPRPVDLRPTPPEEPENPTREVVRRFNEALAGHDLDGLSSTLAPLCCFHNSRLALRGGRIEGRAAVMRHWGRALDGGRVGRFTTEDVAVCGERALVRWMHTVDRGIGVPEISRGVDVFRVSNFRIVEKRSFAALSQ